MRPRVSKLFGLIAIITWAAWGNPPSAVRWSATPQRLTDRRFIDIDTLRVYVSVATLGDK